MKKSLILVALLLPVLGAAQPVVAEPEHAAVPISSPNWNIGAGLGVNFGGLGLYGAAGGLYGGGSLAGATGLAGLLGGVSGSLGSSYAGYAQPRVTVLIERRLSERVFLTFQVGASYSANQNDQNSELKSHNLSLDGTVGIRRVFNPGGLVEVSWFGTAGVGYNNYESRWYNAIYDNPTSSYRSELVIGRGHNFGVGVITGLTFEREFISGLALRLSSGVLGFSYGKNASTLTSPVTKTDSGSHGFDIGLRFNPAIELRYAF